MQLRIFVAFLLSIATPRKSCCAGNFVKNLRSRITGSSGAQQTSVSIDLEGKEEMMIASTIRRVIAQNTSGSIGVLRMHERTESDFEEKFQLMWENTIDSTVISASCNSSRDSRGHLYPQRLTIVGISQPVWRFSNCLKSYRER